MVTRRETKEDTDKQKRLFEVFSKKFNLKFNQFSSFSKKYRIDGYCYDDENKINCWIECKWYTNKAHCFLNVPKFNELISLSELSKLPSYLLFREYDKWGFILLHNGKEIVCSYEIKRAGGTPKNRIENDDDIEPLIILNKKDVVWGN
jgi:hypothetical protein